MNKKWNILLVHNYYQISGGEDSVVKNEKRLLEAHGNKVIFYHRSNNELKRIPNLCKLLLPFIVIFNPKTYIEIQRLIEKENIDIVHVHNTLLFISSAVYYAARKHNIPVVQTVHNFRLICPNATFYRDSHICEDCLTKGVLCAIKHKCYRNSRIQTLACVISTKIHSITGIYGKINYICLTEFNKNKLLNLKQLNSNNIFLKPNFSQSTAKKIVYGKRKNQYIFVGRIEKLKGIDKLLAAWKELEHKKGNAAPELIICGDGPLKNWCQSYIIQNNLNHIKVYGIIPNEEIIKMISVSKALILPTQCYEGFPMVIAEAYSTGTPVIGSDLGNTKALIHAGKTGEKFVYDSPTSLVEAIDRFESGPIEKYQENAYNFYINNFTPEANYKQLIEIYRKIMIKDSEQQ